MARYIDAENLIRHLEENIEEHDNPDAYAHPIAYGSVLGLRCALSYAETLPTADVVEVKHGEWVRHKENCLYNKCSICEKEHCREDNYCPNRGAKMDGERKEK